MKIGLLTDSTATLSPEEIEKYHIEVVPIPLEIDGQVYLEGIDITTTEFYKKLADTKHFPKTSQPSVLDTIKKYQEFAKKGYDAVISIHLTSGISGFINNLQAEAKDIKIPKIYVFDSWITARLMGEMVLYVAKQIAHDGEKANIDEILNNLKKIRESVDDYFIVNDLQNLVKGGRLSNAGAFIGNMLKIKPLLTFDKETHKIIAFEKVRSIKRANQRIEEIFKDKVTSLDYPVKVIIIQGNDEPEAQRWQEILKEQFPDLSYQISYFGPVIGTHLGNKSIGITWIMDYDKVFLTKENNDQ